MIDNAADSPQAVPLISFALAISGQVLAEQGGSLMPAQVDITACGSSGCQLSSTARDGSYQFILSSPGTYRLEVDHRFLQAAVTVTDQPVVKDFYLRPARPLTDGVTFTVGGQQVSSGVPTSSVFQPLTISVPVHIPPSAPNSIQTYEIMIGVGADDGGGDAGINVAGAELFSVFYNADGWPTRMSRIVAGALDCGPAGSNDSPCAELASEGLSPTASTAASGPSFAKDARQPVARVAACDNRGNYVPDQINDGHFHIIPNEFGGIDLIEPLVGGLERIKLLAPVAIPIPDPIGNPLVDTGLALGVGGINGTLNLFPAIRYYNIAVGALNGLASIGQNPAPVDGGPKGLNMLASLLIAAGNLLTHGQFYWDASIASGELNAVLGNPPPNQPPVNPCKPPKPKPPCLGPGCLPQSPSGPRPGGPSGNFYVDPSGIVETRTGVPLAGATVTLFRAGSPAGRGVRVPRGSSIMSPGNRRNPDLTGLFGNFGWDVAPGFYRVAARKRGCAAARTGVLAIPPPITNLLLRLRCPSARRAATRMRLRVLHEGAGGIVLRATVTVARRAAGGRSRHDLAGTVRFRVGRTTIASLALDSATRTAILVLPPLQGRGRFGAAFSGDAVFAPSHAVGG